MLTKWMLDIFKSAVNTRTRTLTLLVLISSGYGRTAVQLMRDWNSEPQKLAFASSVKPHTLVSILQEGLLYDELLSDVAARDTTPQRADRIPSEISEIGRRYTFVDRRKRPASQSVEETRTELSRQRQKLQTNGSPEPVPETVAPRAARRKSSAHNMSTELNGDHGGSLHVDHADSAMEDTRPSSPDEGMDVQADDSLPITSTLLMGASIGVQSVGQAPAAFTIADVSVPGSEMIHVSWGISDPTTLLATGDSIWRTWSMPSSLGSDEGLPEPDFTDHASLQHDFYVYATARAPSDEHMAVAVEDGDGSELQLFKGSANASLHRSVPNGSSNGVDKQLSRILHADTGTILALRWNSSSSRLLAIHDNETAYKLAVYDLPFGATRRDIEIGVKPAHDACWTADDQLILCGENLLSLYSASTGLSLLHSIDTPDTWTIIKWDPISHLAAGVAAASSLLAIFDVSSPHHPTTSLPNGHLPPTITQTCTAFQPGQITALEWQPTSPLPQASYHRLLATSSTTGTVNLWVATTTTLQCVRMFHMGGSAPALAMAFSPNGAHLAAAGENRVKVWRSEVEGKAVAVWEADRGHGVNGVNGQHWAEGRGDMEEELPFHTLAWDARGSRLAFARGDRLRIIGLDIPR